MPIVTYPNSDFSLDDLHHLFLYHLLGLASLGTSRHVRSFSEAYCNASGSSTTCGQMGVAKNPCCWGAQKRRIEVAKLTSHIFHEWSVCKITVEIKKGLSFTHIHVQPCRSIKSDPPKITRSRWWFQPIWKILIKMGIFPRQGWKKHIWKHHLDKEMTNVNKSWQRDTIKVNISCNLVYRSWTFLSITTI